MNCSNCKKEIDTTTKQPDVVKYGFKWFCSTKCYKEFLEKLSRVISG